MLLGQWLIYDTAILSSEKQPTDAVSAAQHHPDKNTAAELKYISQAEILASSRKGNFYNLNFLIFALGNIWLEDCKTHIVA